MQYAEVLKGLKDNALFQDNEAGLEALQTIIDTVKSESFSPALSRDQLEELVVQTDDGKALFDSLYDRRFSRWEQEKLPERLEKYHSEKREQENPPESPEAKELAEMRKQIADMQTREKRAKLENLALEYAQKENIPADVARRLIRDDEESTVAGLNDVKEILSKWRDEHVQKQLSGLPKDNGKGTTGGKKYTAEQLAAMSDAELVQISQEDPDLINSVM
jgi:hypothetical protein